MKNVLFLSLLCFALLSAGCKPTQPPSPCACTDPSTCTCTHPHNADGSCTCGSPTCKCNDGPQDTVPYQLKLVSTKVGDPITEEEYKSYTTLPQGVEEYYHHTGSEGVIAELVEFVPVGNETLPSGDGNSAPAISGSDDNPNDVKSGYIVTALDKATKGTEKADDAIGKLDPIVENADKKYTDGAAASAKKDRDALDVYRRGGSGGEVKDGDYSVLSGNTGYKNAYAKALQAGEKEGKESGTVAAKAAIKNKDPRPSEVGWVDREGRYVGVTYEYDGWNRDVYVQGGGVGHYEGGWNSGDFILIRSESYPDIEVNYTNAQGERVSIAIRDASDDQLKAMGTAIGYAQAYGTAYNKAVDDEYNAAK